MNIKSFWKNSWYVVAINPYFYFFGWYWWLADPYTISNHYIYIYISWILEREWEEHLMNKSPEESMVGTCYCFLLKPMEFTESYLFKSVIYREISMHEILNQKKKNEERRFIHRSLNSLQGSLVRLLWIIRTGYIIFSFT